MVSVLNKVWPIAEDSIHQTGNMLHVLYTYLVSIDKFDHNPCMHFCKCHPFVLSIVCVWDRLKDFLLCSGYAIVKRSSLFL